jgi:CubicO group peptidase (beta-lactamase class C family)
MASQAFTRTREVILSGLAARVCPAAVIEVGASSQVRWSEGFGHLTFAHDAAPATPACIFDLASLTKVLAAAALVMRHVERGSLGLDDRVADHLRSWRGADREHVTIGDLLAHCSGLPAYRPLYLTCAGGPAFEAAITSLPLEYVPRTASVYSDLGFILLGRVLERVAPLDAQFDALRQQVGPADDLQYLPPAAWTVRAAPTQQNTWRGRLLVGEVDDDNAFALGGVAAHAGLFGTAAAVGAHARHLLQILDGRRGAFSRESVEHFATPLGIPGSSRALGWDTMLPSSSCGSKLSRRAFGHTGFTGTSLWIDPERDLYVVLLTNRVHPVAQGDAITSLRRTVHEAVVDDLESPT